MLAWLHVLLFNIRMAFDVFFQKIWMTHLGKLDTVGGPVDGLNIIVTGPTSGIGRETAATLVRRGANVTLACRSIERGEKLKKQLEAESLLPGVKARGTIDVMELDVGVMKSVRKFTSDWEATGKPLHVLINNAGVMNMGVPRSETSEGLEVHMATNCLGPFLLSQLLLPALRRGVKSRPDFGARVVNVSSIVHEAVYELDVENVMHRKNYNIQNCYGSSKLAQVLWTREMRNRLRDSDPDICVVALHPGDVLTDVVRTLPPLIRFLYNHIMGLILISAEEGARSQVYCATSPTAPREAQATDGYFYSNGRPQMPSKAAQDPKTALWVWNWACEVTQLPQDMQLPVS